MVLAKHNVLTSWDCCNEFMHVVFDCGVLYLQVLVYMWVAPSCRTGTHHFTTTVSLLVILVLLATTPVIPEWASTAVQTPPQEVMALWLDWMAILTLESSVFNVMVLQTVMLGVCTSTCTKLIVLTLKITWTVVRKEFIPAACLIQLEGTLMSALGYIIMATPVSLLCTSRLVVLFNLKIWFHSLYFTF